VLDYVPGGELNSFIRSKLIIDQKGIQFYMAEVIIALEQMHKLGIVYRDLKTENIMIDKNGHVKLVDFGFSKILKDGDKTYTN
jgi:serine/threonine protein kinase